MFYGTDYPFDWPVGIDFLLNSKSISDAHEGKRCSAETSSSCCR